ncbi:MAG TPA: hypothetical protein VLA43_05940 [Longimicrobiales bacterium]|nr:hypothetical protein [Longimicrobiales bacterium]
MTHWMDLAHNLQVALMGFFVSLRGPGDLRIPKFLDRTWLASLVRKARTAVEAAFQEAAREEKVALLGLVLVLAALTWP